MFDQDALLEYLSSPEGINKIIVGIIIVGAINAIFITYSVRSTYGAEKKKKINSGFNKRKSINYHLKRNRLYTSFKAKQK